MTFASAHGGGHGHGGFNGRGEFGLTKGCLDGLELARRAVEIRPDLRLVYTTGRGLTDGMTALFAEGGIFLPKPYNGEQLIAAVRGDSEASPDREENVAGKSADI